MPREHISPPTRPQAKRLQHTSSAARDVVAALLLKEPARAEKSAVQAAREILPLEWPVKSAPRRFGRDRTRRASSARDSQERLRRCRASCESCARLALIHQDNRARGRDTLWIVASDAVSVGRRIIRRGSCPWQASSICGILSGEVEALSTTRDCSMKIRSTTILTVRHKGQ